MTTTVNADTDTEFSEDEVAASDETTSDETKVRPLESLDELSQMLVAKLHSARTSFLSLYERVKSATDGAAQKMDELISESSDPEVVQRRTMLEKLNKKALELESEIQALIRPHLNIPSEDEIRAMQAEASKFASTFKQGAKLFEDINDGVTVTSYVENLPGFRTSAKSGTTDTGTKRPRLKSVEVAKGTNPETATFVRLGDDKSSTFSHLRKWVKDNFKTDVQTADLHGAWTKQNHTEDWTVIPDVSNFTFSVDGKSFLVRISK